ncbi:MAG: hypothetical protein KDC57_10055 [Saprospiraceae bacterium]|nr:hypothetical protein [Saprospiraceae bacterium]
MLARCQKKPLSGITIEMVDHIREISQEWMSLMPEQSLMHVRYYRALEAAAPDQMQMIYGLVRHNGQAVMAIPAQILPFNARRSLKNALANPQSGSIWDRLRTFVAGKIHFYTLIIGNVLLTGEYAYTALPSLAHPGHLLDWAIEEMAARLDRRGLSTSVILIKDFTASHAQRLTCMEDRYFKFRVQPNMCVQLPNAWHSLDDYLNAMTSKYRVRTNKVLQNGKGIQRKFVSANELAKLEPALHQLYLEIANQADFNLFMLHPNYFSSIKNEFGSDFEIVTYWNQNQMIGFFTYFNLPDRIEAHFLGYDPALNKELSIYHNMLLDLLRAGLKEHSHQVVLGRTALEIKSSIGAQPQDMFCLLRHRKRIHQHFVPYLFEYLRTDLDWEPRNPFREAVTALSVRTL